MLIVLLFTFAIIASMTRGESDHYTMDSENGARMNGSNSTIFIGNNSGINGTCLLHEIPLEECLCEKTPIICKIEKDFESSANSSKTVQYVLYTLIVVCLLVSIIGNSVVLLVSYTSRRKLTSSKKIITQMAIIDFISSMVLLMGNFHLFLERKWVFGVPICRILSSLAALGTILPIGYILIIALERFFGILHPLQNNLHGGKATDIYAALNIICGILTVAPLLFVNNLNEDGVCVEIWPNRQTAALIFNWFLLIFYFVIPASITAVLYGIIMRYLSQQLRTNQAINRKDIVRKRQKNNRRTMTILLAILALLVICLLPTRISVLYLTYRQNKVSFEELKVIAYINNLTYPLHVTANPFIYSAIDREWRMEVLIMLRLRSKPNNVSTESKRNHSVASTNV